MKLFKDISWRSLIIKILGYGLLTYLVIVTISIIFTGIIFFNLDSLKHKLIKEVNSSTGGSLAIGNVQTKLNTYYLPEIIIDNLNYKSVESSAQSLQIKHIDIVLDYSTLWRFEPIFNKIQINGSELNFVLESNNALYLNNIKLTDGDDEDLSMVKPLDFNIERFILNQKNIDLDNVGLSFEDLRTRVPKITLNKINFYMVNSMFEHHDAKLSVFGSNHENSLQVKLNWIGGQFQVMDKWKTANLNIDTNYKESSGSIESAQSIVSASLKDGMIQHITADFDINNFKLFLNQLDVINLPDFDGSLSVNLYDNSKYIIKGTNLHVSSSSGVLFDNSEIDGEYLINKNGYISVSNANLVALNNLLSLFSGTRGILLDGVIKEVKYTWNGELSKPSEYNVSSSFQNLSLISQVASIPSLNNISGELSFNKQKGQATIKLNNSKFDYSELFFIPYQFNSAVVNANWSISESGVVLVNLESAAIDAKDFRATAQGKFSYDPNNAESPSFIDMTAHADKIATSLVADYLPKSLPIGVHNWLKMGLIGGTAESADMILKGPLGNFPFADNSGKFYITANVVDAKLLYVKDWAPLEHIYGKFILDNTNITVLGDRVNIRGNIGDKVKVVIPDYASESGVVLIADAEAHGKTNNFMSYLVDTPINKIIGDIPEKSHTSGDGKLKLYLKVPFNDPHHTIVDGTYDFIDNNVDLGLPSVPPLSGVNGKLEFTHYGVNIKHITATALNSTAYLSASTKESDVRHQMKFNVEIPDLDYKAVSSEYLSFFAPIVDGREPTNIKFTIGKHGLDELVATSNLKNVSINAPAPLALQNGESRKLQVKISPTGSAKTYAIDWRLGDEVRGVQYMGEGENTTGKVAVGNNIDYLAKPDKYSLMTVNANLESVNIDQWISVVGKLASAEKTHEESGIYQQIMLDHKERKAAKNPFPIQVKLLSEHMFFGKQDFGQGVMNVLVTKNNASFNMYTPITSGYGSFDYKTKIVSVNLDKYMLYKKLPSGVESNLGYVPLNFTNGSSHDFNVHIPDIKLNIANLFLQNHNLGKVSAQIHQQGRNLYLESGVLFNKDYQVNFHGVNYCFGCDATQSYVNFEADANVANLGNLIYNLDFGHLIDNGYGKAKAAFQWNGGFQDFHIFGNIGKINAKFYSGNIPNIQTGALTSIFKILDLQGLYKAFMDPKDLFKDGYFFDTMDMNVSLLTTRLDIDSLRIYGPLASIDANGVVNLQREDLDVDLAVKPHIGFAVAVAAGVATLNPLIGLGVYGVELLSGGLQDKLVSFTYEVTGKLNKPKLKKTNIKDNLVHNVNSTVDLDYGL